MQYLHHVREKTYINFFQEFLTYQSFLLPVKFMTQLKHQHDAGFHTSLLVMIEVQ